MVSWRAAFDEEVSHGGTEKRVGSSVRTCAVRNAREAGALVLSSSLPLFPSALRPSAPVPLCLCASVRDPIRPTRASGGVDSRITCSADASPRNRSRRSRRLASPVPHAGVCGPPRESTLRLICPALSQALSFRSTSPQSLQVSKRPERGALRPQQGGASTNFRIHPSIA